jgi:hypothetical protein
VEILLGIFKRRCALKDMGTIFIQAVAWRPSVCLFIVFPLEGFIPKRTRTINRKERFLNLKLEQFMTFILLLIINTNDLVPVPFAYKRV